MKIWQIAAGDGRRDYTDVFIRFGVILVGPDRDGEYFANMDAYNHPDSWAYRKFIRAFAEDISKGDFVVLKRPSRYKWEIVAVGEVISDYRYEAAFGDVDGWELQHCRRVRWKTPNDPRIIAGLRRGTLAAVNNEQASDQVTEIWSSGREVVPSKIPQEADEIAIDELIDSLIVEGMPGQNAQMIADTIWRLRRIARWYNLHGSDVGEHEIRTFLIVSLLTSLGWAEQEIKIEWNNIDVTLFDRPYSSSSRPLVIIESKRLWDGLLYAPSQAATYEPGVDGAVRFFLRIVPR